MCFHAIRLMVQWCIDPLISFFDILSCILIDGSMVHWRYGFILWYSLMHFDWWFNSPLTYWLHSLMCFHVIRLRSNGPLTYWLHSLMFFHVFRLKVQWSIDLLASFFDVLSCISIDGPMGHWRIGFILWVTSSIPNVLSELSFLAFVIVPFIHLWKMVFQQQEFQNFAFIFRRIITENKIIT